MSLPRSQVIEKVLTAEGLHAGIDESGIAITHLAQESQVDRTTIYRFLRGQTDIGAEKLKALWGVIIQNKRR